MRSVILPDVERKPSIAIVGPGNLGTALARSLHTAGYDISTIVTRTTKASQRKGKLLAKKIGTSVASTLADSSFTLAWLCVPDSQIANAARTFASQTEWKGKIALHSSGALPSQALAPLRKRGAAIASLHPLMTFVPRSNPSLAGVSFAVEGDARAVRIARRIVQDLAGRPYSISKRDKAAYHAWCTFASPLLTALLATSDQVAALAGIGKKAAARRMTPILLQTIHNYANLGPAAGFSGPIIRGDIVTLEKHLLVLRKVPAARDAYLSLARSALEFLPAKNQQQLKRLLKA